MVGCLKHVCATQHVQGGGGGGGGQTINSLEMSPNLSALVPGMLPIQ